VEQVDARRSPIKEREALELLEAVDEVYASKGTRVVHLDLKKDKPDTATVRGALIGPSGNLRAPTLRKGRTLLVGFDAETYKKVLGVT
jgi:hypothetical protein